MIKKLLLGLLLTTGLMMADTTSKDDLLSLATMGKTTGNALEMNKADMEKADGGFYYINRVSRILNRYYQRNMINLLRSRISSSPSSPYPGSSNNSYSSISKVEAKRTYHLGIGKSVYMTPTAFKSYLVKNY
ncbi:MAG: hypothetical protein DRG78_07830 [Epsilonproteobacteria bacterium]|nr:MAG: hypothetical protein DRG78_07830 [Campylobacterota bacterium]